MKSATKMAYNKILAFEWIKTILRSQGKRDEAKALDPKDYEQHLVYLLRGSPRLRKMLPIISEQVFQKEEKSVVWTQGPGQQAFVTTALKLANIDARILGAQMSIKEREELVREFNEEPNKCMVLVCSYAVNSAGLNLQYRCRNTHLFDVPMSEAIVMQAVGRLRRLGQEKIVLVYEYRVPDSFNTRLIAKNVEKVIPGLIAELNRAEFSINVKDTDQGAELVLGQWGCDGEGRLVKMTEENQGDCEALDSGKLVELIVKVMKGEETIVEAE